MLALIGSREHLVPSWTQYAERITALLLGGVPIACKSHKPADESHLQEICDGILKAQHDDLVREFPFMRWGSGLTKPDWSVEERTLWIELKYVRKKADIRPISEDIAADITKYGDNGRHCLFLIYDPGHLIINEKAFSEPILRREGMLVRFIR
jgi:REase_DpnII-MboI